MDAKRLKAAIADRGLFDLLGAYGYEAESVPPELRDAWARGAEIAARMEEAVVAFDKVSRRPDVKPGSASEWLSNTRLRQKIHDEGGIFFAATYYGIDPDEIDDPVVAAEWEKVYDIGIEFRGFDDGFMALLKRLLPVAGA